MINKILIPLLLLLSFNSIAQLSSFPVLIGYGQGKTISYLDSLSALKGSSPSYIDKRSGIKDLVYDDDFGKINEDYYTCLSVSVVFKNIKGKNVCIEEIISGTKGKSDSNSNYLQHMYTLSSDSLWIKNEKGIKIEACFHAEYRRFYYSLHYRLIQ